VGQDKNDYVMSCGVKGWLSCSEFRLERNQKIQLQWCSEIG